ncbi:helix-turn-helix transcriptional regulator [Streptomyces sp. NBC_01006]|uniref:helix-turn-helix transcriptional regulator n=1 Tax=Streptomyces sp. NBC_01006 TaxID=2903716 RepID=UPI003869BA29|nr:helix-turn-helix transcriptional regulator [Streptomyces sp. NBC_01006]
MNVSVRTLHRAFDGETVMAYVRRRRLEGARSDLDRSGSPYTVAEVAARWQFADPSHFRRAYRNAYGQSPRAAGDRSSRAPARHGARGVIGGIRP